MSLRNPIILLCLGLLILAGQTTHTQSPPPDALQFFKNYFVTGGSVSGSVDLAPHSGSDGYLTGTIPLSGVPTNADLVGAFLYWETIAAGTQAALGTGAKFHGFDISDVTKQIGLKTLSSSYAPCWSSGGGSGATYTMATYRTDVLRFLPIGIDPTKPGYGKRLANSADLLAHFPDVTDPRRSHTVTLPDAGTGNQVPQTAGASLVVIYRDTRDDVSSSLGIQPPPLVSVVIYDGLNIQAQGGTTKQTMKGFYQTSTSPVATLTYIVGSGAKNATESVSFNNQVIATNPFVGVNSPGSDRGWDGPTFDISSKIGASATTAYGQQFDVSVTHTTSTPYDCLDTTAIVLNTTVQDSDSDGNIDSWESAGTSGTLLDPNGVALPNLYAMGARPDKKDLFVEVGHMVSEEEYTNPFQGTVSAHDHLLTKAAIKLVGDAFKNAPVSNPDGTTGIKLHVDVGNHYWDEILTNPAAPYIIPFLHANGTACALPDVTGHTFDTNCLARGGESIAETACVPSPANNSSCLFPAYRGVVGWKTGFRFLRDEPLDDPTTTSVDESDCLAAPTSCSRRFDRNRKDIFHYALFAHALGVQRLDDPNTSANESVLDDPTTSAIDPTPVPVGVSGTGDGGGSGGGDLMVTLGFWDNFVGTDFMQASTLMHELGHNFALRHGPPTFLSNGLVTVQNCQSNYQSVMNYVFQITGLTIGANNIPVSGFQQGDSTIDYSREALTNVNENLLSELAGLGTMNYATAWYVNRNATLIASLGITGARRHCDGSFLNEQEFTDWQGGNGMVRVDGVTRTAPIDWNMNGTTATDTFSQDISFNGTTTPLVIGVNDWANVDLRQVGSRRNVASFAIDDAIGPLSLDQGAGDNGAGDNGAGDNGAGDNGAGDNGAGDNGAGDNGAGDNGAGDNGAPPEIDFESATDAPHLLKPTISKQPQGVVVTWAPPHKGAIYSYDIWRSEGTVISALRTLVGTTLAPTTTFIDTSAKKNVMYTYFVIAHVSDPVDPDVLTTTGMSNPRTILFK